MDLVSTLVFKIFRDLIFEAPPQMAVIPVTIFAVVPLGSLYWMFAVDAYRRMKYARSKSDSSGFGAFLFSLLGTSFAMGMIAYVMSEGLGVKGGGYTRTRGGDSIGAFVLYLFPALALVLFFIVGMYLGGGKEPSITEWFDRWRHTGRRPRNAAPKRSTGRLWFHVIFWTPAAAIGACAAGIAASAVFFGIISLIVGVARG